MVTMLNKTQVLLSTANVYIHTHSSDNLLSQQKLYLTIGVLIFIAFCYTIVQCSPHT